MIRGYLLQTMNNAANTVSNKITVLTNFYAYFEAVIHHIVRLKLQT